VVINLQYFGSQLNLVDDREGLGFNPLMQTLGLSSAPQPTDGMFKRLFWPEIANEYDVDLVGQQGFWICFAVAVISTFVFLFAGHYFLGVFVGATYFLGALGVRQRNTAAAILIFICYLLDRVASVESMALGLGGVGNPLLGIVATMLLFANIRATILSRRWQAAATFGEESEMPERTTSSFGDKLANVLPEKLWPRTQYVFFPLASILILLSLIGMVVLPIAKQKQAVAEHINATLPADSQQ
jgi:hypothetical protein